MIIRPKLYLAFLTGPTDVRDWKSPISGLGLMLRFHCVQINNHELKLQQAYYLLFGRLQEANR